MVELENRKLTKQELKFAAIGYGIGAALTASIAAVTRILYTQAIKHSTAIRNTEKVNIETLLENPDVYKGKYIKISGVSTSETPLISPMSKTECIMYKSQTWRVVEEMVTKQESSKNTNESTVSPKNP